MPSANSYSSPSTAGGNREDLRDILTIIAPENTPVVSAIRKGQGPEANFVEVMVDTLRAPRTTGRPEGEDVTMFNNKAVNRARLGNYIQIISESYGVSDVEMLVKVAGVQGGNLFNEAKAKALVELKRDMEAIVCGAQDRQQGSGTTTWQTRGLYQWTATNADVPAAFTSGTAISSATEDNIATGLIALFNKYGEPKNYFTPCGTTTADAIDKFSQTVPLPGSRAGSATNTGYQSGATVTRVVNRYVTSFGSIDVMPDVFVNVDAAGLGSATSGLLLNMDLVELQFLQNLHSEELQDYAGGPRGYAKAMFAVCCKNPSGILRIT